MDGNNVIPLLLGHDIQFKQAQFVLIAVIYSQAKVYSLHIYSNELIRKNVYVYKRESHRYVLLPKLATNRAL